MLGLHAGQGLDPVIGARAPPFCQTTSYTFDDANHTAGLYALEADGGVYSRVPNPTTRILEHHLAALKADVDAVVTALDIGVLDTLTIILTSVGGNVVLLENTYGGTASYFSETVVGCGIEPRTVGTLDVDAYEDAIDKDATSIHAKTVTNLSLKMPDLEAIAEVAHENRTPLVMDNTSATPTFYRPIEHGTGIARESMTKWLHGSGTAVGGIAVDGGTFPWNAADYNELSGGNPVFNVDFVERFSERALAEAVRQRAVRSTGSRQPSFDAWQILQGVETLALRMRAHYDNACRVAEFLRDHDGAAWVTHSGFEDHETHDLASKYLQGGYAGTVTFGLDGEDDETTYEAAKIVCESVDLVSFLANIGDAKTLLIRPTSTTHARFSMDEQRTASIAPDMLWLSIGIEGVDDIIDDFDRVVEHTLRQQTDGDVEK